ncbi:MAG: response regulator [Desulfobacterales bacterium]|nr:response regulator [Desulfobacterales bacterium]
MANILILDDQQEIQELLFLDLGLEGHRIVSVSSAEMVWDVLKDLRFDLVIMDLYLNGFESWDTFRDIKRKYPKLPAVLYVNESNDSIDRLKQTVSRVLSRKNGSSVNQQSISHLN